MEQQEIRKALGTRDWDEAQRTIREWETLGAQPSVEDERPITIEEAGGRRFLPAKSNRN